MAPNDFDFTTLRDFCLNGTIENVGKPSNTKDDMLVAT